MLKLIEKIAPVAAVQGSVTLSYEQRMRSRLRLQLDDGADAGLFLPRGETLSDGDCLRAESGEIVRVNAAAETLSSVRCDDPLALARACYHLGNRHVPLQIEPGLLRYAHDHVLDDMLRRMGLTVAVERAAFEPEAGAYGGHASTHAHHHDH
ncbi:MAG: urease accessory protein UreE [Thiotrichales bacterium]